MKNIILAALFLVSWNEDQLVPHYIGGKEYSTGSSYVTKLNGDYFTVELSTHSIKLATREDADIFIRGCKRPYACSVEGLIGDKAFNVKVEEIK